MGEYFGAPAGRKCCCGRGARVIEEVRYGVPLCDKCSDVNRETKTIVYGGTIIDPCAFYVVKNALVDLQTYEEAFPATPNDDGTDPVEFEEDDVEGPL